LDIQSLRVAMRQQSPNKLVAGGMDDKGQNTDLIF
jgi:hypothetical protein